MSQLVLSQPFSGRFSFVVHVRLMVFLAVITLLIFALSPTLVSQAPAAMPSDLIFVPNMGQADASVQFQAHQGGNRWLFTQDEIIYSWVMAEENDEGVTDIPSPIPQFSTGTLRQQFLGTNKDAQFAAADPLASKLNYILGSDSSRWQTDLLTYATISAPNFYPGIDVVYQGQAGALELMLVIQPGANIEQIRWQYEGVTATELTKEGKLQLTIAGVEVKPVLDAPLAWQLAITSKFPLTYTISHSQMGLLR